MFFDNFHILKPAVSFRHRFNHKHTEGRVIHYICFTCVPCQVFDSACHYFSTIYLVGMNRKRALISDTFKVKRRKNGIEKFGIVSNGDSKYKL